MRSVLKDEGWRENKIGEGLVDDSKDGSQCLIYLFFILIDFCGFLNVRRRFKVGFEQMLAVFKPSQITLSNI